MIDKGKTLIEPISFLIAFSFGLSETVITDEILLKTCEKVLGENSTNCSSLSSSTSLQEIVQPRAATILALKSFIENFVPAIVCIFFGSWCDVIGRKPILLIAVTGTVIHYASIALLSYFNVNAYWYLAVTFFTSLFGGYPIVIMACYMYAIDIVDFSEQFRRLNFVDLAVFVGKLAGCLVYPWIVKRFGYWLTFIISSYICLLTLIYTSFFLKESWYPTTNDNVNDKLHVRMTNSVQKLFQWSKLFSVKFLGFALIVIALNDDNIQGTSTTLYLYAQQFQWTLFDLSIYAAIYFIATAVILLLLSSKFIHETPCSSVVILAIGLVSSLTSAFTRAFAKSSTHLYTALGIGAFSWIPQYFNRNNIVHIDVIPKEDFSRGFTAITALERIALSFIIPLNIYLCSNFITTYPHPVWLMQAVLQLVTSVSICGLFIFSLIYIMTTGDDDE